MKEVSMTQSAKSVGQNTETTLPVKANLRTPEVRMPTAMKTTEARTHAIPQRNKISITFDPNWDIVADSRGVYEVSSGCTPHNPNETRLIIRNAEYSHRLHPDDEATVIEAANTGTERELHAVLNRFYFRVGRAAQGTGWQ